MGGRSGKAADDLTFGDAVCLAGAVGGGSAAAAVPGGWALVLPGR